MRCSWRRRVCLTIRRDIYVNTAATGLLHAADCVIEEVEGRVRRVAFRYRAAYLEHPGAFTIDPVTLPLTGGEFDLRCDGGMPGFLDDYLPDDWGRKVLARAALHGGDERFDGNRVSHLLAGMGASQIGALSFVAPGEAPSYTCGVSLDALRELEQEAAATDGMVARGEAEDSAARERFLLQLLLAAGSVGGARPKALVFDDGGKYLAKLNRRRTDEYNTDDHERNFSLIHRRDGYRLSPAYDLTPSLALGAYHAAGFGYEPSPPAPSELSKLGRVFGLSKPQVRRCAEEVAAAVERWPEFAERAGVEEEETARIGRCFCR